MEVILLERIGRLGQMGDVVKVKDGYARNFLLPQGKAMRATKESRLRFEKERVQLEARNLELKKEAESVAEKLAGKNFVVLRQAGDSGQLYGSVSSRDVSDLITAGGFSLARNQVLLDRPIKSLGVQEVRIGLHPEVIVKVNVNVARTEEEAERQARGEDITQRREEVDEDAIRPEDTYQADADDDDGGEGGGEMEP